MKLNKMIAVRMVEAHSYKPIGVLARDKLAACRSHAYRKTLFRSEFILNPLYFDKAAKCELVFERFNKLGQQLYGPTKCSFTEEDALSVSRLTWAT